jgi:hypothetical protein
LIVVLLINTFYETSEYTPIEYIAKVPLIAIAINIRVNSEIKILTNIFGNLKLYSLNFNTNLLIKKSYYKEKNYTSSY